MGKTIILWFVLVFMAMINISCHKEGFFVKKNSVALELRGDNQGVTVHHNDVGFTINCGGEEIVINLPDGHQRFVYNERLIPNPPRITPSGVERKLLQVISSGIGYGTESNHIFIMRGHSVNVKIEKETNDQVISIFRFNVNLIGVGEAPNYFMTGTGVLILDRYGEIVHMRIVPSSCE